MYAEETKFVEEPPIHILLDRLGLQVVRYEAILSAKDTAEAAEPSRRPAAPIEDKVGHIALKLEEMERAMAENNERLRVNLGRI